jgi:hypothetical protein
MKKLFISIIAILMCWLTSPGILHSELIAPTRTLESAKDDLGILNVFSEPPALEISLDGKVIGKTPLLSLELSSGTHVLRIDGSEAKIFISARKATSLSWFKGSFIQIPEKTKTAGEPVPESKRKETKPGQTEGSAGKESIPTNPIYWPLNPRGPIY